MAEKQQQNSGEIEKCDKCGEEYGTGNQLREHIEKVHNAISANMTARMLCAEIINELCEECNNTFKDKRDLNTHIQSVHQAAILTTNNTSTQPGQGTIEREVKSYTTSELNLLNKKKAHINREEGAASIRSCLLYTSPSPRDS